MVVLGLSPICSLLKKNLHPCFKWRSSHLLAKNRYYWLRNPGTWLFEVKSLWKSIKSTFVIHDQLRSMVEKKRPNCPNNMSLLTQLMFMQLLYNNYLHIWRVNSMRDNSSSALYRVCNIYCAFLYFDVTVAVPFMYFEKLLCSSMQGILIELLYVKMSYLFKFVYLFIFKQNFVSKNRARSVQELSFPLLYRMTHCCYHI